MAPMSRYFIVAALREGEEIPEGAKIDNLRMSGDYTAQTHELKSSCDCRVCRKFFPPQKD